tara:strand:+ start:2002 stop:2238 length:237 start_codon:yes stop_codon:yes gene_type:complete
MTDAEIYAEYAELQSAVAATNAEVMEVILSTAGADDGGEKRFKVIARAQDGRDEAEEQAREFFEKHRAAIMRHRGGAK